MPTNVTVNDLKINKLTEAQYDTAVQGGVIGENELSIITDLDEAIQVSSLPTAGALELGKIYQYIGATDANYTNGYFYKCVGEGSPVVYSWAQVNVQPAVDPLPSQSGQSGKFLTTDGTDASWTNIPDPLPSQTGNAGKVLTTDGTTASWVDISTSPSTMPQLLAANWSSNTQTINVTGVTANNVVMVSPSPVSATEYAQCGILCTAQAAGTLTFTCTSVPTNDLTVNVVCF